MREADRERTRFRRRPRETWTDAGRRFRHRPRDRRSAGLTFVRQDAIGRFVAEFRCRKTPSIVELDGRQHADGEPDHVRDAWLTAQGYRVLRLRTVAVANTIAGVLDTILAALPPLSPRAGRGEIHE